MKVPFRFNLSDMVNGDVDAFTASVQASGRAYGEDAMRNLLKYSGSISEAMGNAVDGRGKRFGWPVIIEVLEGVEIDFDENSQLELPTMISDRDLSKVVPYPPIDDAAHRQGCQSGRLVRAVPETCLRPVGQHPLSSPTHETRRSARQD